ncbi:MAG: hypothetical protein Q8R47_05695 [Nanoarchaeota archaeon]|nr:hypothetical protein [Nanoarchaeota archaeon]
MVRYRLLYTDRQHKVLAIQFAHHRSDYVPGDFYVRALKGTTDIMNHNKKHGLQDYTPAYTLDRAIIFIQKIAKVGQVHDCLGLRLEDEQSYVNFNQPIMFRNMASSIINSPAKTIDASAIRKQTWYEDTEHILSTIWGEEKAKRKIGEWRLPQELAEQDTLEYKIKK